MTFIKGKYLDINAISEESKGSSVSVEDYNKAMAKALDSVDKQILVKKDQLLL